MVNIIWKGFEGKVVGYYGYIKDGDWVSLGEEECVKRGEGIYRKWCLYYVNLLVLNIFICYIMIKWEC